MTANEMLKYKNRLGWLKVELSLTFAVVIIDAREKFGRLDLLVHPRTGDGEKWVSAERVILDKPRDLAIRKPR